MCIDQWSDLFTFFHNLSVKVYLLIDRHIQFTRFSGKFVGILLDL